MVASLNKVSLIGCVGKFPEIRTTQDGREMANISLTTSDTWVDKSTSEKKEKTEWHKIIVFIPALVNVAKNYIHKGSRVYIEGMLQNRKWTDHMGIERSNAEVVLQNSSNVIVLLGSKGEANGDKVQREVAEPINEINSSKTSQEAETEEEDLPF